MEKDDLSIYFSRYGDCIAVSEFCKRKQAGEKKKESLIKKLKRKVDVLKKKDHQKQTP